MRTGLTRRIKPVEPKAPTPPDISSTSAAKKALHFVSDADRPGLEAQIREQHPDLLIERRNP